MLRFVYSNRRFPTLGGAPRRGVRLAREPTEGRRKEQRRVKRRAGDGTGVTRVSWPVRSYRGIHTPVSPAPASTRPSGRMIPGSHGSEGLGRPRCPAMQNGLGSGARGCR